MCGIFGTIGNDCVAETLRTLHFLEYRGYDSAGIAVKGETLSVVKTVGRVSALEEKLNNDFFGQLAIGHTRWATHGEVSEVNAHPFLSPDGSFAICHNGIIENYEQLKKFLQENGLKTVSQTDSEVVALLLQHNYCGDVLESVRKTARMLKGAFAVLILNKYDNCLYAIKHKSPLVAGVKNRQVCLCSDMRGCFADKIAVIGDGSIVKVCKNQIFVRNFEGTPVATEFVPCECVFENVPAGDVMFKEIMEIPRRVRDCVEGYFRVGLQLSGGQTKKLRRIYLLGCGTAYNSGAAACSATRKFLNLDVFPVVASEFVYDTYTVDEGTLAFCISQSGETADTIRAAEKVAGMGGITYAVTNTPTSTLGFVCDKVQNVLAGDEFAVASTKAYNCQLVTLLLLLSDIARRRGGMSERFWEGIRRSVVALPLALEDILSKRDIVEQLAEEVKNCSSVFFVGRVADYPTAAEGSLKLKEISYLHSEAYPSGELKHGTLALMEKGVSVVVISTIGNLIEKNESTAREISSRNASVITVSPYKGCGTQIVLPVVHETLYGVVSVVPLQLLAYYVAKKLGRDVDKPRNLAKSVTVE